LKETSGNLKTLIARNENCKYVEALSNILFHSPPIQYEVNENEILDNLNVHTFNGCKR
jgi:hypothetical protein